MKQQLTETLLNKKNTKDATKQNTIKNKQNEKDEKQQNATKPNLTVLRNHLSFGF